MYLLVRKILFNFDAEKIHQWVMKWMQIAYKRSIFRNWIKFNFTFKDTVLATTMWGIRFPNPVGIAGGFDKNADYYDVLACLGFGFVEIGTVTPLAQLGNPKPRLFRLPDDKALINRMGFNNKGVKYAAEQLREKREKIVIAGNIGKNKGTPNDEAINDYETCFNELYDLVDFFIVNVSSPNTAGLRELQDKEPLYALLSRLMKINKERGAVLLGNAANEYENYCAVNGKPILLKIAPDLNNSQIDDIIDIIRTVGIHGIVATNTTTSRYGLVSSGNLLRKYGDGGLSGKPLREKSTEIIRYIHKKSGGTIPIIACGGIFSAKDAKEKLDAGATLVQLYTGFVYEGPRVAKRICEGLKKMKYKNSDI